MEEFDELMPVPDAEGALDLQHRAWLEVDEVVWTMGLEVTELSVAYNRLSTVSPELGDLKLLRVFDCSCNRITRVAASVVLGARRGRAPSRRAQRERSHRRE